MTQLSSFLLPNHHWQHHDAFLSAGRISGEFEAHFWKVLPSFLLILKISLYCWFIVAIMCQHYPPPPEDTTDNVTTQQQSMRKQKTAYWIPTSSSLACRCLNQFTRWDAIDCCPVGFGAHRQKKIWRHSNISPCTSFLNKHILVLQNKIMERNTAVSSLTPIPDEFLSVSRHESFHAWNIIIIWFAMTQMVTAAITLTMNMNSSSCP